MVLVTPWHLFSTDVGREKYLKHLELSWEREGKNSEEKVRGEDENMQGTEGDLQGKKSLTLLKCECSGYFLAFHLTLLTQRH